MFYPSRNEIALPWVVITMICWGLWPRFRNRCGCTSPAFSILNVCSQVLMATLYGLTLGTAQSSDSSWLNKESFLHASSWGGDDFPSYRHGAVLLGGFILGHADNISSVALQRIPEGVAYLVYGGSGTVLSQLLNYAQQGVAYFLYGGAEVILAQIFNYIQEGSKKPYMLLGGMLLVLGGILSTSLSQFLRPTTSTITNNNNNSKQKKNLIITTTTTEETSSIALTSPVSPYSPTATDSLLSARAPTPRGEQEEERGGAEKEGGEAGNEVVMHFPCSPTSALSSVGEDKPMLDPVKSSSRRNNTTRDAILLALVCGVFCGTWSPLSTFAMNSQLSHVPFVVLLIFPCGQLLALPSVVAITLYLENQTRAQQGLPRLSLKDVFREIKALAPTKKAWGITCGMGINSGYCFYFSATATIPSAVVFGITCCSSIIPLLREVCVTDSFTGAPNRVRVFLLLSFTFYAAAIGVLASIA